MSGKSDNPFAAFSYGKARACGVKREAPTAQEPIPNPQKQPKMSKANKGGKNAGLLLASFGAHVHSTIRPHTLLCGTFPSVKSLEENQYFGHPSNCFWWIAGEALGFCRKGPIGKPTVVPKGQKGGPSNLVSFST